MVNSIAAGNNTTVVDNPTAAYIVSNETVVTLEDGDSNIQFSDGYKGYCIEWGEHSAEEVIPYTSSNLAIVYISFIHLRNRLFSSFNSFNRLINN